MLQHILAANIEDNRQFRPHRNDVGEVLVRTDTEINAAGRDFLQLFDDVLEGRFIRNEIVRAKISIRFGKFRDHVPECFVAQFRRQEFRRNQRAGRETQRS